MVIRSPRIVRQRSIFGQGEIFVAPRIGRGWKLSGKSVSNPWLTNVLRQCEIWRVRPGRAIHKWLYAVGPPVTLTGPKFPSNFQGAFRLEGPCGLGGKNGSGFLQSSHRQMGWGGESNRS